jgi:hypothetical protein
MGQESSKQMAIPELANRAVWGVISSEINRLDAAGGNLDARFQAGHHTVCGTHHVARDCSG